MNIVFFVGLVVCLLGLAFFTLPLKLVGEKIEYVRWAFLALSVWWLLCVLYSICRMGPSWPSTKEFEAFTLLPNLAIVHQLYPFKMVKRNRTVSFLLWGALAISLLIIAVVWILVQFSSM